MRHRAAAIRARALGARRAVVLRAVAAALGAVRTVDVALLALIGARCRSASYLVYASTIRPTRECRTTSSLVRRAKWMSSISLEHARNQLQPARAGREVDLRDVAGDDHREPKPSRVRNIFICSGVVFCASSSTTKALFSVRPRM